MKTMKNELLYLSDSQVEALLTHEKVLELVEDSFREYALGNTVNPAKLHLPIYPDYEGYINSMPAYMKKLKIAGAKLVSVYHNNPSKFQLPSTIGTVLLHDPETGKPYSVMGGTYITAARTGAVMGVMAKYVARKDSKTLTIIGTGVQGFYAFIMIALALRSLEQVRLVDINPAAQDRFIKQASELFPEISYVKYDNIPSACQNADIILAAANSEKPLLSDITFNKGTTVLNLADDITNSIVGKFDQFVADFTECLVDRINQDKKHHCQITGQAFEELSIESVTSEIGDIIIGKDFGRKNNEEIIMAASVGMGIQDIIVADEAYRKALENDTGTVLPL